MQNSCALQWQITTQQPVLAMNSATIIPTANGRRIFATYTITGNDLASPGTIDFYWATGPNLSDKIGTTPAKKVTTSTQASSTPYTASTSIASLGARPANAKYILAVADSPSADPAHNVASVAAPPLPRVTQLAVTAQPPAVVGLGSSFDVKVAAEDANRNVDTSFTGPVTIALDNNPTSGSTLSRASGNTLTVNAVNGVADFPDLTLNLAGEGYTLQATSNGLNSPDTNPFTAAYTPAQIRAAYGLPSLNNLPASWSGACQTIAIVVSYDDPNLFEDLEEFDTKFGIPQFGEELNLRSAHPPLIIPEFPLVPS